MKGRPGCHGEGHRSALFDPTPRDGSLGGDKSILLIWWIKAREIGSWRIPEDFWKKIFTPINPQGGYPHSKERPKTSPWGNSASQANLKLDSYQSRIIFMLIFLTHNRTPPNHRLES